MDGSKGQRLIHQGDEQHDPFQRFAFLERIEEEALAFSPGDPHHESGLFALRKLRGERFDRKSLDRIRDSLCKAYLSSNDPRCYNELLWFTEEGGAAYRDRARTYFEGLIQKQGFHPFPLMARDRVLERIRELEGGEEPPADLPKGTRVALIGTPHKLRELKGLLEKAGSAPVLYLSSYHPNKAIRWIAGHTPLLSWISKLMGFSDHRWLPDDKGGEEARRLLEADAPEIGFHKVPFIIREGLIAPFSKGLLNDHWGVLPFVRGRSSIEFSVLFGFPLRATVHFVTRRVDEGDILCLAPPEWPPSCDKLDFHGIRNAFRSSSAPRVFKGMKMAHEGRSSKNVLEEGLTFYSMHPVLKDRLEKGFLPLYEKELKEGPKC